MSMVNVFLVIWINPFCFGVSGLCVLNIVVFIHDTSSSTLKLSISNNLLATHWLQLHSVQLVLVVALFLHQRLLFDLLWSFKVNLILLFLIEAFEMIWLNSMVSKHANFSLRIFSHQIVIVSEFNFSFLLSGPSIVHNFIVV